MSRAVPHPTTSAIVLLTWLLLNNSLSPGHLVLGVVLGLTVPIALRRFLEEMPKPRHPLTVIRLLAVVTWDIISANIELARRILGREDALRTAFVWVPLELKDPHGIFALAAIIALTPGTVSVDVTADRRHLLVHSFHVDDTAALVAGIKRRYETPLRRIFD